MIVRRIYAFCLIITLLFTACDSQHESLEEKFKLGEYAKRTADYYNPILNELLVDSTRTVNSRVYEAYYDSSNRLRYLVHFMDEIYALHELHYGSDSRLDSTTVYFTGCYGGIDNSTSSNLYLYHDANLETIDYRFGGIRIEIRGDSAAVFNESQAENSSQPITLKAISDFFIRFYSDGIYVYEDGYLK